VGGGHFFANIIFRKILDACIGGPFFTKIP